MTRQVAGILGTLGITLGVGGAIAWAAWRYEVSIPLGAIGVALAIALGLFLFLTYTALTAGLAWAETCGPEIEIGPLLLDRQIKVFYVWVTNGDVPAKVVFRIIKVADSTGEERTERSWQGHWRGRPSDFDGELGPGERIQYALLGVGEHQSGNPSLFIYSRELVGQGILVSRNVPVIEQGGITITVAVDCSTTVAEKVEGKVKETVERTKMPNLQFRIAPDPVSEVGYRVTQADAAD